MVLRKNGHFLNTAILRLIALRLSMVPGVLAIAITSIFIVACDEFGEWSPAKHQLASPWNTYLVGERTVDTSGSVYGRGSTTDTFDGTNVFTFSSYQHWDGGSKLRNGTCYITRIELHQESWEIYSVWRIFYKIAPWYSESDFNDSLELAMRVPTTLSGKSLGDFVQIPGP